MSIGAKVVLAANVLLLALNLMSVAHAQRPPEADPTGTAYLKVNINPTNVPPMVNINPNQYVPHVLVTEMPEVHLTPAGCQNRKNFQTGVGRLIQGPLMITYLHVPPQTTVTLSGDTTGSHSMSLASADQINTAIFLGSGERLQFGSDVMYSGCRPE
jgi:hypothetical protein